MKIFNYKFTKAYTQMAKGAAILLMICHHLLAFPERLTNVYYSSIIPFSNNYFEILLGRFGKICVSMFLFLSGYGLYICYTKKGSFKFKDSIIKIESFLLNYWVVFIIFVPIGLIWFSNMDYTWTTNVSYSRDLSIFISNFFLLSTSYNGEWWFARLYIEFLILFPIIRCLLKKNTICYFIFSLILCILPLKIHMFFEIFTHLQFIRTNLIYTDMLQILLYQPVFVLGCLIAKYDLFKVVNTFISKIHLDKCIIYLLIVLGIIATRLKLPHLLKVDAAYIDILITPLFILLCTNIISKLKLTNGFILLGRHSGNIWLTHTFFGYYYFQKLIFYPKMSVLVILWVCVLSIGTSSVVNFILSKIHIPFYSSMKKNLYKVYLNTKSCIIHLF